MKLKDYIKHLEILNGKGHGDCEIVYSIDDEGNDYKPVYYVPSYFKKLGDHKNVVCLN